MIKFRTSNILKFVLLTVAAFTVLTIFIYEESLEGRIAKASSIIANRMGTNCEKNRTIDHRIRINEPMEERRFRTVKEMEKGRIDFPPQPKNLIAYPGEAVDSHWQRLDSTAVMIELPKNVTEEKMLKKILFWNSFQLLNIGFGRTPFLLGDCKYNNCFGTAQRDRFDPSDVDALVWHVRGPDPSLPKIRYHNARYIFLNWEPVNLLFARMQDYKDIFDITFTYREDSDIPFPYNEVATRKVINETYSTGAFNVGKTKMAAWFVSNCNAVSGRSRLVKRMKKYLEIDIYGSCGNLTCGSRFKDSDCFKDIEKKYFFYLSFENSLCKDYITEKFFNALSYDVVPVVYGYGPYWKHAPPHSYIDVFDFTSIKELAQYLIHLSNTPEEYNEYFRWKTNYFVLPKYSGKMGAICKLCEILNTPKSSNASRYDLQDWMVKRSRCKEMQDPIISSFLRENKLSHSYNQIRCFIDTENC